MCDNSHDDHRHADAIEFVATVGCCGRCWGCCGGCATCRSCCGWCDGATASTSASQSCLDCRTAKPRSIARLVEMDLIGMVSAWSPTRWAATKSRRAVTCSRACKGAVTIRFARSLYARIQLIVCLIGSGAFGVGPSDLCVARHHHRNRRITRTGGGGTKSSQSGRDGSLNFRSCLVAPRVIQNIIATNRKPDHSVSGAQRKRIGK